MNDEIKLMHWLQSKGIHGYSSALPISEPKQISTLGIDPKATKEKYNYKFPNHGR